VNLAEINEIDKSADESRGVPLQIQDFCSLTGDDINFQLLQEIRSTEGHLLEISTLPGAEPMNVGQGGRFDDLDIVEAAMSLSAVPAREEIITTEDPRTGECVITFDGAILPNSPMKVKTAKRSWKLAEYSNVVRHISTDEATDVIKKMNQESKHDNKEKKANAEAKRELEKKARREREAKRESGEEVRREREAKKKAEAEAEARRESEKKADDETKRELEEKARREREAKKKADAEAKRESEEEARREREEKNKAEAEAESKRESE
jgi:hypothetical protein